MKIAKLILPLAIFVVFITAATNAQTNVSGGIYSNTTWTAANSPYIVVDTVVVFPGVTLTIQPGVTVKFENDKRLEIRQAKLIAVGTSMDSITFTSNSSNPTPGIWENIWLNNSTLHSEFNYCNIMYANEGIFHNQQDTLKVTNSNFFKNNIYGLSGASIFVDSCRFIDNIQVGLSMNYGNISNCFFSHNNRGIHGPGGNITPYGNTLITNCVLDSNQIGIAHYSWFIINDCIIKHNQYGIIEASDWTDLNTGFSLIKNCTIDSNAIGLCLAYADSVMNCGIKYNDIGIMDSANMQPAGYNFISGNTIENNGIGIKAVAPNNIVCNKICNNSIYDFYNKASLNATISNNYWCTTDSTTIAAKIYDGYDNINLGLVSFMPLDTLQCYLSVGITDNGTQRFSTALFPNPASEQIAILLPAVVSVGKIKIISLVGEIKYARTFKGKKVMVNVSDLPAGLYIVEIITAGGISKQKFIKQ